MKKIVISNPCCPQTKSPHLKFSWLFLLNDIKSALLRYLDNSKLKILQETFHSWSTVHSLLCLDNERPQTILIWQKLLHLNHSSEHFIFTHRDKTKFQIVSVTYLPHDIFSTQLVENKSKVHFPRTSIHWNGNFA